MSKADMVETFQVIDAFTSRLRDVTNIAGFWSKRSSKNHCSQWEPYGILLLFSQCIAKIVTSFS